MAVRPKSTPRRELRLRRLLSNGFFPNELPPPFTTEGFAAHAVTFASAWNARNIRDKFWTTPESYSIPRFGHARRKLSIVNPVNQLAVSHLIADNWIEIRRRLRRSKTTEFKPKILLAGKTRAVSSVDFDGVARRKIEILARFGRIVKTDIAQFYPSIYTHSIAWAILGKAHCKSQYKTAAFRSSYANLLDRAVSSGQNGQTSGIPIGPDTSRILSELVITEVEEIARINIDDWDRRTVRYVDDMIIGLAETEAPADALSGLATALYEFELELNASKTMTLGLRAPHAPEWNHYISTFQLSDRLAKQRSDLDSYFEQVLFLQDNNYTDSVLLFAVKRAATFDIDDSNAAHFVRWMLYCARRSPNCLAFVAEHLAAAARTPGKASPEIERYILEQIPTKATAVHTDELAWLLFWALEIGLTIPTSALVKVVKLRSSVVAILTMDLLRRGKINGTLDISFWRSFCNVDGLSSEMWMAAYEITKKDWWPSRVGSGYARGHQYFGSIWNNDVEFYDIRRRAKTHTKFSFSLTALLRTIEAGQQDYR